MNMALHTRLSTVAICILGASTAAAQHLLLPFSQHSNIPAASKLSARASSDAIGLSSSQYAYVVNVSVGTPAQKLSLLISPSTGDTWVPDANTLDCSPDWYYRRAYGSSYDDDPEYYYDDLDIPDPECKWGSYNKSVSSTYLRANARYDSFRARYGDGTSVSGTNVTDKLVVGDVELDDYPLGVVSSATRWIGVLGLGSNNSGSYYNSYSDSPEYSNFMDRIVSSGKIASPAYSIWLDNAQGTSGGLLFGAIDKSRFTGDLVRLDAYDSSYSSMYAFSTTISTINGTDASGSAMPSIRSNDFPVDVNFGPGEVFSWLPELLADKIAETAGAKFNSTLDYYTIPCDTKNTAKFVFELGGSGGPQLHVETADLVVPATLFGSGTRYTRYLNGTNTCLFGINKYYSSSSSSSSSSSYDYYNIGSSLLRRTYLVFDLANKEIAIAPVKFPSGSEKPTPTIVAFESYAATVPSASAFCTSSYCRAATTGGGGSRSGSGYGSSNSTGLGLEHWQQVAIGVGVSFGVLFLVAVVLAILVCVRLRRRKAEGKEVEEGDTESAQEEAAQPAQMTENTAAAAQNVNGARAPVLPPGNLPAIQERQEGAESANAQTAAQGANESSFRSFTPQIPALDTQLGRPITPPEPAAATSNRDSVAVSALSDEQQQPEQHAHAHTDAPESAPPPPPPAEEPPAVPRSPKGKGKEVDRSAGEN